MTYDVDNIIQKMKQSSITPNNGNWLHNILDDLIDARLVNEDTLDRKKKRPYLGPKNLTNKHIYLLMLLSYGMTIEQISEHAKETPAAIRDRLRQCRKYFKARTATQAVAIAIKRNLI